MPAVFRPDHHGDEEMWPPHLPRHRTVTVTCPECHGRGGTPSSWEMVDGKIKTYPAKKCLYCKGQKTVFAKTEPR